MDLARSIQEVTEEVMLRMARTSTGRRAMKNLCLAGGVALNCVAQRTRPPGRALREHLDPARRGRRRRRPGRGPLRLAPGPGQPREAADGRSDASRAPSWARPSTATADLGVPAGRVGAAYTELERRRDLPDDRRPHRLGKGGRLVPGPHGVRPPGPGRPRPSSATPARRRCSRS